MWDCVFLELGDFGIARNEPVMSIASGSDRILHLTPQTSWEAAQANGEYQGATPWQAKALSAAARPSKLPGSTAGTSGASPTRRSANPGSETCVFEGVAVRRARIVETLDCEHHGPEGVNRATNVEFADGLSG